MSLVDNKTREQTVARVLAARERRTEFLTQMRAHQQQGWQAARKAAKILKEFGAQRVVLFGSMLDSERMTWHSDIDLAVWGIPLEDYLRAGAAAEKGHDFPVDLIDAQSAPPHILVAIHQGIEL